MYGVPQIWMDWMQQNRIQAQEPPPPPPPTTTTTTHKHTTQNTTEPQTDLCLLLVFFGRECRILGRCCRRRSGHFELDALLSQVVELLLLLLEELHEVPLQPRELAVLALPGQLHVLDGRL